MRVQRFGASLWLAATLGFGLGLAWVSLPAAGVLLGLAICFAAGWQWWCLRRAVSRLRAALGRARARPAPAILSQETLQQLMDALPQPLYLKDASSRYVMINAAFCRERGQPREALLGKSSFELAPDPATAALCADEDARVLAGEHIHKEESGINPATGLPRSRIVNKAPARDLHGQPVIIGSNFDVTPWRQAEQLLQATLQTQAQMRAQLQHVFDAIPDPVFVKDEAHRYLMINAACQRFFGAPASAVVGHVAAEFLPADFAEAFEAGDRLCLAKPLPEVVERELSVKGSEGMRHFVVRKLASADQCGQRYIVGVLSEVTSLLEAEAACQRAREAAEQANRAKSAFLASMSHELRTPLHGILGFARLGRDKGENLRPEKVAHYFEQVVLSGERLLSLLNDLLDLSKLEAGRADVNIAPMELLVVVRESADAFEAVMDSRQQRLHIEGELCPHAAGDAERIAQVVGNLLSNAIKFSPPGSSICLRLGTSRLAPSPYYREGMEAVELVVADEGCGIPPDELESIFDRFVQSSKLQPGVGGSGLGLAICREIVRAHRGELFARNRDGGGAEFVLRLPVARPVALASVA